MPESQTCTRRWPATSNAAIFPWDGGFGTSAYSDPKNDFIGILMTQRLMDSPEPPSVFDDFWTHAYRSLET
jgi:CubicO group peptidase (beta-lactamase class C family)